MSVLLRIVGLVNGAPSPFDGQFLAEYDPDREGVDPDGHPMLAHVVCTGDPAQAMRFDDLIEAMHEWKRVSDRWPVRPDGKPNRPLTAFTVETAPAPTPTGS